MIGGGLLVAKGQEKKEIPGFVLAQLGAIIEGRTEHS